MQAGGSTGHRAGGGVLPNAAGRLQPRAIDPVRGVHSMAPRINYIMENMENMEKS